MTVTYRPPVYFSVKDFGAVGDGSTDDTTAIQDAINAAQLVGGRVYLPAPGGFYKTTAGLLITKAISFCGENTWGSAIKAFGLSSEDSVLTIDGTINPNLEGVEVSGITLISDNDAPDLIVVNRAANSAFRDIGLRNCRHGIVVTGDRTFSNVFDRVLCVTSIGGDTIRFDDFQGGGNYTFIGCDFGGDTGVAITPGSAITQIAFMSCNFEGCETNAFYCGGSAFGLSFAGCRSENCQGSTSFHIRPETGETVYGLTVSGCSFGTNVEEFTFSLGGDAGEVRGFTFTGNYVQNYSSTFVRLNGEGQSGFVAGNRLENVPSAVNTLRPGVLVVNNENTSVLEPTWAPPLETPIYTVNNVSTDRDYDASATTLTEIANVLGTLIADLRTVGLVN